MSAAPQTQMSSNGLLLHLATNIIQRTPCGGGSSSARKEKVLLRLTDGTQETYFLKSGPERNVKDMLEGEHASLTAMYSAVPSICPKPVALGSMDGDPESYFLLTTYLEPAGRGRGNKRPAPTSTFSNSSCPSSLAAKLAKLHSTPAPIPRGHTKPQFGFPVTTYCGDTPQTNTYNPSWPTFFAENRLIAILRRCETRNGLDQELADIVSRVVKVIVPRLLNPLQIVPVVVHGDLWAGNATTTVSPRGDDEEEEEVTFDPASCYAHGEYDLGMMRMFGGFGRDFWTEYERLRGRDEPVEEFDDRLQLYELFHHLNHIALFGSGYKSGAIEIMKRLLSKYDA
ncbi:1-phosphatidylinositol-3-phosphate 5-kinase [Geranomyces variabilis]|uniref:protein-ribulosamine 3-kinase n=1 Tax=Geranomyces variabilis TaxID=109894 RepID=A0AAD5XP51_9FUNG|nr:1-phosphatidylinositol-3-phosphate 5-kinase [Geranomyces variabilis]